MIAIGLGLRNNCAAADIVACVQTALAQIAPQSDRIQLFTIAGKEAEVGLREAAQRLGYPLSFLSFEELATSAPQAQTQSSRIQTLFNLPNICETAALAGAGAQARLLLARQKSPHVTCAIAQGSGDQHP